MEKKIFLLVMSWVLGVTTVMGQQDPLYSQYILNPLVINPAYSGMTNNLSAALSYRHQWAGLEGSPKTINFNAHISLHNNKMGTGLIFVSDKIGSTAVNEVYATYAYRIKVTENSTLSFGLQGGIVNYQVDNSNVKPYDPNDPYFPARYSETKPSIGAGIILTGDKFFIGLSVPRMLKSNISTGTIQTNLYTQHFYALGSYLFQISERVKLKPSTLVKVVSGAPLSVDLNAAFIFYENYQAGLLTRNFNTYGLFMQAIIKDKLRFGYVFEVPTGSSVGSNFTTHEITVGYRVGVLSFHDKHGVFNF